MSALMEQRADAVFDSLVLAGVDGCTIGELHRMLIVSGLAPANCHRQIVRSIVDHIRDMFAADGAGPGHEVITCDKRSHRSRYFLALDPNQALEYRRRRCQEIKTTILTVTRQVATERERFGGEAVFTAAALDYLGMAVRELERGGTMQIVLDP